MRLLTRSDIRQSISMREAVEVVKRAFGKLSTGLAGILSLAILALCLSAGLFLSRGARAEQLPVKTYTTADGLLRDQVNRIKRDSRGFLWFCTNDGLSRFDGYGFTNYTTDDGLPNRVANDLLETRSGAAPTSAANGEGGGWVLRGGRACGLSILGAAAPPPIQSAPRRRRCSSPIGRKKKSPTPWRFSSRTRKASCGVGRTMDFIGLKSATAESCGAASTCRKRDLTSR